MIQKDRNNAYTVTQVNRYIGRMFENDFALSGITIQGEISNLKYHSSGHIYFTLKDTASQISGIMFAGNRAGLSFRLEDGMRVLCTGSIGVYERGGSYQIYAKSFVPDGLGELYIRFEQLKKDLADMGLFDPMYKKPVPKYAKRIGVVTARTGAAVRDIIQIAKRRNPYVEIVLYPALVQGDGAKESIVRGIQTLDDMGLDVIIVGRGGGSIEDLWAFNEECVARAIFDADTPIISAVGHETDTTIADFAADLRAPTPSAAAELAVYDFKGLLETIAGYQERLRAVMTVRIQEKRQQLSWYSLRVNQLQPMRRLEAYRGRLQAAGLKISSIMQKAITRERDRFRRGDALKPLMEAGLIRDRHRTALAAEKLEAVSPLKKLSTGFGYLRDEEGHRIGSISQIRAGKTVRTTLKDGSFESIVSTVTEKEAGKQ